jgi:pimeloyl-ACP methyl ester carboxylesterase
MTRTAKTQQAADADPLDALPPVARLYYTWAFPIWNGYRVQAEAYLDYYKARKERGLGAVHPVLWVWGYTDPKTVTAADTEAALALLPYFEQKGKTG